MEKVIVSKTLGRKGNLTKAILSILCLVCLPLHIGFNEGCPWWNHILYSFSHVNIFHLTINLIVLWNVRNKLRPIQSFVIAVAASFLPMYASAPTMGISGLLFASFGQMWGRTGRLFEAAKKAMPFILCTMIIPNVNGLLHLYAFCIGYFFGYIVSRFKF